MMRYFWLMPEAIKAFRSFCIGLLALAFVLQGAVGCEAVSARPIVSVAVPILSDHCLEMMNSGDDAAQADRAVPAQSGDGPDGGMADHHDCSQYCHPPIISIAGSAIAAPLDLREATPARALVRLVGDNAQPATPPPRMN